MEIISHRGFWIKSGEKNTKSAFLRSFNNGFGTETDFRDYNGELIISHDVPNPQQSYMSADEFFQMYAETNCSGTLAINIKSDGLQVLLSNLLNKYEIKKYFIFDSSIPDTVTSLNHGLNCFIRFSEFESKNSLWERSSGVWMDRFSELSINIEAITQLITDNKSVAIVSDELHHRNHLRIWEELRTLSPNILLSKNLILCTDLPNEANNFFKGYI